jgi:Na+/proline symporter
LAANSFDLLKINLMGSSLIAFVVALYFLILLLIARITSRGANNSEFFIGHRSSRWYLVAYGMIGTSLSGVTFMSVPGGVLTDHFYYLQIVFGYFIGYMIVAFILLPLYYRLHLTSIYSYLGERFGRTSYLTGAGFFLLSRTLGACARIYLVLNVLQVFLLDSWGMPFAATVGIILLMILLYTYQGGVKTIVWTDTLQTTFMILALIVTIWFISGALHLSATGLISSLSDHGYSQVFNTDWHSPAFFLKQMLSGAFITVAMTGLDQEMMQKNISCKTLPDAQKNMLVFSITLVLVNLLFLILGGVLYLYLTTNNIPMPAKPDAVFPTIALRYLPPYVGLIFIIGLVSALFPSADGAMTALTSSFCIDILVLDKQNKPEELKTRTRKKVHLGVVVVFLICILAFKWINSGSVITLILKIAGYTYAPLVALYVLGLYSRVRLRESWVPVICIGAPIFTYIIDSHSAVLFGGYKMGFETAFVNVAFTLIGLGLISKRKESLT